MSEGPRGKKNIINIKTNYGIKKIPCIVLAACMVKQNIDKHDINKLFHLKHAQSVITYTSENGFVSVHLPFVCVQAPCCLLLH